MGLFYAGVARSEKRVLRGTFDLPLEAYCKALSGEPLMPPMGMYVPSSIGSRFAVANSTGFSPLTSALNKTVAGLQVRLAGYDLHFIFHAYKELDLLQFRNHRTYRPFDLNFVSNSPLDGRLFIIKLGWSKTTPSSITYVWTTS
jgi:hypothetical protein